MLLPLHSALELRSSEVSIAHESIRWTEDRVYDVFDALRSGRRGTLALRPGPTHITEFTNELAEWQLTIEDGSWIATLRPDSYSVKGTTHCEPLSTLRAGIVALTRSLEHIVGHISRTELHLRYVHVLDCGPEVEAYRSALRPQIFERSIHTHDAANVALCFPLEECISVKCTGGFAPSSSPSGDLIYCVDATIVRRDVQPYDATSTIRMLDEMHRMHGALLCSYLSDNT